MKSKTPHGISKTQKRWNRARNVIIGLASLSAVFTFVTYIAGNVVCGLKREEMAQQFDEVLAQVEPKDSLIDRTLSQAEEDLNEGRINDMDYLMVYQSMQYVRTEISEYEYVNTYATPEVKAKYKALDDECYKPAIPYHNMAKAGLLATGVTLAASAVAAIGAKSNSKKESAADESAI